MPWDCHASSCSARSAACPRTGGVGAVDASVPLVELRLAGDGRLGRGTQEHDQIGEEPQRRAHAADLQLGGPDVVHPTAHVERVGRGDAHHVDRTGGEEERHPLMGQRHHERVALGWAGHDGGPLDREEAALEVHVVELVAVDETAGGDVADDGVVLPAVPQPPDDLDGVGRLVEQVARCGRPPPGRPGRVGRVGPADGRAVRPRWRWPTPAVASPPGLGSRSRAWRRRRRCGTARCGSA